MTLAVFTIAPNDRVAHASLLFRSVRRHLPDADCVLVLADEPHPDVVYPDGVRLLPARALGIDGFREFAFRYEAGEFAAALKPYAFLRLLRDEPFDQALYLDPETELFAAVPSLTAALDGGASVVLVPQLLAPAERADAPDDVSILRSGAFDLGVLGVAATAESLRLLAWWSRQLRVHCVDEPGLGLFVDQKFMDLLPAFAAGARILRHPTLAVSAANWRHRDLVPDAPGGPTVGGRPLALFQYRAFADTPIADMGAARAPGGRGVPAPDRPDLGPLATAPAARDRAGRPRGAPAPVPPPLPPALRAFLADHAARLDGAGRDRVPPGAYAYGRFRSGTPIPPIVRRWFRDDHPFFAGDPFRDGERWLHLAAIGAVVGIGDAAPGMLARWLQARTDAVAHLSPASPVDAAAMIRWWLALPLDPRLLAPAALAAGRRPASAARLPPPDRSRADVTLVAPFGGDAPSAVLGRALEASLRREAIRVETREIAPPAGDAAPETAAAGRIALLCATPEALADAIRRLGHGPDTAAPSYRIWVPAAEDLADAPLPCLDAVDEIWAPTAFAALRLALAIPGPVLHVPVGLAWPSPRLVPCLAACLPASPYVLAVADELPGDGGLPEAIEAWRLAFAGDPGAPPLVVQPRADADAAAARPWRDALAAVPDAVVLDGALGLPDRLAVLAGALCLLSAHRGEALGLGIAAAQALAVPVVATGVGAAAERVAADAGFLAEAHAGGDAMTPHRRLDPRHAAWHLREIRRHPDRARERAAVARRADAARRDAASAGMSARLAALEALARPRG